MAEGKPGILFDLDGVLYQGGEAIAGAAEVLLSCRQSGVGYRFLTNTTSRPRAAIVTKLAGMGIIVEPDEILTPAVAAAAHLAAAGLRADLYVPEATRGEFAGLEADGRHPAQAVVIGDLGAQWDFDRLNSAFRLLMTDESTSLIALGMTRYWRAEDGLRLDTGPFVRALEYASGRSAQVYGKPAVAFFLAGCQQLGLPTQACIMVGDDAVSDVAAAQQAGLCGLLVRTGKFQPSDLAGEIRPDGVLESIADLPQWLAQRFPSG